jgi:predicted RNase H-like nuclease (RuvC/YqgF family)
MEAMRQSWSDDRLDDLQLEMRNGFVRIEKQIQTGTEQVEKRIEQVEMRIEQVDRRIEQMDKRIDQLDTRVERLETRVDLGFGRLDDRIDTGFGRLDGRIDSQTRAVVYFAAVLSTIVVALLVSRLFV